MHQLNNISLATFFFLSFAANEKKNSNKLITIYNNKTKRYVEVYQNATQNEKWKRKKNHWLLCISGSQRKAFAKKKKFDSKN